MSSTAGQPCSAVMSKINRLQGSLYLVTVGLLVAGLAPVDGLAQQPPQNDLTQVSMEDLLNVQINSVSKKDQELLKAAAAIFVISQEDIRRSGAATIPDLLRMVPGIDVAQVDANTSAISIRGFNSRLVDKVLVLIDGRTVYTPTTSGVYWDQQDVPLENIERIEVIRGPGGTVWGANAVNGVINIITKSSRDTQGVVVSATGGTRGDARGLVQYGGQAGSKGTYRVFESYSNTGNLTESNGQPAADGWHLFHSGFRSDWKLSPHDTMTVEGDAVQTSEGQTITVVRANALPQMPTFNDSITVNQGDVLTRWNHTLSNGSSTSLQVYYDRYNRRDFGLAEIVDTLDFDFQHHIALGSRNDIVWGGGYRFSTDSHVAGYGKTYVPLNLSTNLFSTFIQDEFRINGSLAFIVGSKFERQPFAGFQVAPSAQLIWTPTERQSVWLSAAEANREVSRDQTGLLVYPFVFPVPGGGFGVQQISGNPDAQPERLRDLEIGYRAQATERFSLDLTGFASHYRDLRTADLGTPYFTTDDGPPHVVLPVIFGNGGRATTYGAELFGNWNVASRWKLRAGYSAIHLNLALTPGNHNNDLYEHVASTPENQFQIRSLLNLSHHVEWDSTLYYVGRLRDGGDGPVPAYTRVDTRLGWRFGTSLELSLVGQNLLSPRHPEFHDAYEIRRTLMERSVFGRVTWRF